MYVVCTYSGSSGLAGAPPAGPGDKDILKTKGSTSAQHPPAGAISTALPFSLSKKPFKMRILFSPRI